MTVAAKNAAMVAAGKLGAEISREKARVAREALVEDLRWMLANGESPAMAAVRVGKNARAIVRLAYRHGWDDIARAFYAEAQAELTRFRGFKPQAQR